MPRTTTLLETLTDDHRGEPLGTIKVTTTTYQLRAWRPSRGRAILTDASRRTLAVATLDDTGWRLGAVGIPERTAVEPLRRGLAQLSRRPGEHPEHLAELLTELSSVLLERSTGKVWRLTTPEGETYYSTAGEAALRFGAGKPGSVDFVLGDTLGPDAVFVDTHKGVTTRSSLVR